MPLRLGSLCDFAFWGWKIAIEINVRNLISNNPKENPNTNFSFLLFFRDCFAVKKTFHIKPSIGSTEHSFNSDVIYYHSRVACSFAYIFFVAACHFPVRGNISFSLNECRERREMWEKQKNSRKRNLWAFDFFPFVMSLNSMCLQYRNEIKSLSIKSFSLFPSNFLFELLSSFFVGSLVCLVSKADPS